MAPVQALLQWIRGFCCTRESQSAWIQKISWRFLGFLMAWWQVQWWVHLDEWARINWVFLLDPAHWRRNQYRAQLQQGCFLHCLWCLIWAFFRVPLHFASIWHCAGCNKQIDFLLARSICSWQALDKRIELYDCAREQGGILTCRSADERFEPIGDQFFRLLSQLPCPLPWSKALTFQVAEWAKE